MNNLKCPVCEGNQFQERYTVKDYFLSQKEFSIAACTNCGMLITLDAPRGDEMTGYYKSEDYISHSDTREGLINRIYHLVRQIMLDKKLSIIKKASGKTKGNILDIGTGTGYFLNFMKEKGWKVTGTEKSEGARNFALKRWNLDILPDEELFSFRHGSFDVITLWHVLEHLPDLHSHFRIFSSLLSEDGSLLVALPNAESYDAKHYGKYWAALDVPRHLWHFSPRQIREFGHKEGFTLENVHRMPFDAFYISIMSEKYKQSGFPFLKGIFIGKISWLASLFNKNNCSSLVYVFRKTT